jgi:hypothetical protein
VWQDVREELHPQGLEVVTVALDVGGLDHAGRWIEAASPRHPALIDQSHRLDELFGVVNVPSGIWIDEEGMLVRPPSPAWPGRSMWREQMKGFELPDDTPANIVHALEVSKGIKADPDRYIAALRDWVSRGADSPYVLEPDEVIARSRPRAPEHSAAAAHFELGQHLWRAGEKDAAVEHFKEAHRLQPENWTYKRQAWQFVSPVLQDARDVYGTSWAEEVERSGPENYYKLDF